MNIIPHTNHCQLTCLLTSNHIGIQGMVIGIAFVILFALVAGVLAKADVPNDPNQ
jgi:hypothetical protein